MQYCNIPVLSSRNVARQEGSGVLFLWEEYLGEQWADNYKYLKKEGNLCPAKLYMHLSTGTVVNY